MQADEVAVHAAGAQAQGQFQLEMQRESAPSSEIEQPATTGSRVRETTELSGRSESEETQLAAIRELMMRAMGHGSWLTLGEIAAATEFGEASVSAQLRHLRKSTHGRYRVEKRRRRIPRMAGASGKRGKPMRRCGRARVIWEYRVLPPG